MIVVPPAGADARVVICIDPRVPFRRAAEVVDGVRRLIKESADLTATLAACPGCTGAYALG